MKVNRKYLRKIPDLKEFQQLAENLTRSYVKIQELYPNKLEVSFELTNGACFYSYGDIPMGAVMGDLFKLDNPDAMTSLAMDLQQLAYSD